MVVSGASSGLGRSTSLELARRRARVVIASRRADTLNDTARLCRQAGAEVVAVVADVTSEADVANLVSRARELRVPSTFGSTTLVTVFGSLAGTPIEDHRRVMETNLWGAAHGRRPPQLGLAPLVGWIFGHYGARALRHLAGL